MLIKDRLCNDNFVFQKGGQRLNKKDREPCRRFNRGKCSFCLSCKYDHRCSVPKCGKFGHGAHICRVCLAEAAVSTGGLALEKADLTEKK